MGSNTTAAGTSAVYLDRPDGRIAYDASGQGPLVMCAPGMGDLRSVYRFLAPALAEAGYRVATMDLRGHGESDATFSAYDDVATGTDLIALVERLGGPAVLVGNSMSAGGAAWAAAERPDLVVGLVLIGPFVRNVPIGHLTELMFRFAMARPWGPRVWNGYYRKLYPGRLPADLDEHRARIRASMKRPGHARAFVATTHTSHAPVEARLSEVHCPTLVVMGDRDPDFSNPAAEARLVANRLGGTVLLVPGAGHYPQAQFPEVVTAAMLKFLMEVQRRA
jgi:pimeloyl-ACP methyl ester carboxylesterase